MLSFGGSNIFFIVRKGVIGAIGAILFGAGVSSGEITRSKGRFFGLIPTASTSWTKSSGSLESRAGDVKSTEFDSTAADDAGGALGGGISMFAIWACSACSGTGSGFRATEGVTMEPMVVAAVDPAGRYCCRAFRTTGESCNRRANFL
jgi:hypothetical protein